MFKCSRNGSHVCMECAAQLVCAEFNCKRVVCKCSFNMSPMLDGVQGVKVCMCWCGPLNLARWDIHTYGHPSIRNGCISIYHLNIFYDPVSACQSFHRCFTFGYNEKEGVLSIIRLWPIFPFFLLWPGQTMSSGFWSWMHVHLPRTWCTGHYYEVLCWRCDVNLDQGS